MELKDKLNDEEVMKIAKKIREDSEKNITEDMIKNNYIEIPFKDKKYRVRLLNPKEKRELASFKSRRFTELLGDKNILLEKDLIALYKERGMDITKEFDDKTTKLNAQEHELRLKNGEAVAKDSGETAMKTYEEQIEEIELEKAILQARRSILLEVSLENQLTNSVAEYITYLSLEVWEDTDWKRLFNSFEEFENYKEPALLNDAGLLTMQLQQI
jgi:hypothetical protein